ncbi:MAG: DUF983 domain-containing protein [Sciscionella sp.]
MARLIRGPDGREWILHRRLMWRSPATADDFEHDMAGGQRSAIALALLLVVLVVVLVAWTPNAVVLPGWLLLVLVAGVAVFLLRWGFGRPWTLLAETDEDPNDERPAEHWVGTVHGTFRSQQQLSKVAREIEMHSIPHVEGPLHPVD